MPADFPLPGIAPEEQDALSRSAAAMRKAIYELGDI